MNTGTAGLKICGVMLYYPENHVNRTRNYFYGYAKTLFRQAVVE